MSYLVKKMTHLQDPIYSEENLISLQMSRRYNMALILPTRHKTLYNQSFNQSITSNEEGFIVEQLTLQQKPYIYHMKNKINCHLYVWGRGFQAILLILLTSVRMNL